MFKRARTAHTVGITGQIAQRLAGTCALAALLAAVAVAPTLVLAGPSQAASGTWDRAWGKDVNGGGVFGVCTVAASCKEGVPGGLGGEMRFPRGVATDSSGNLYVAEAGAQRIQKFDTSGAWDRAWGRN